MDYLPCIEITSPRDAEPDSAVIWLHGLGADGNDFVPVIPELQLPAGIGVHFVFPNAPAMPVTINNGYVMPAWYDIQMLDIDRHVDEDQLRDSARKIHDLIDREVARGIEASRIVLAGFSQGGAVAYEAALTYGSALGGVVALSTYFPTAASVAFNPVQASLPLLVCHGSRDPVVPEALGKQAVEALQQFGLQADYKSYPMEHAVCMEEIAAIGAFLRDILA